MPRAPLTIALALALLAPLSAQADDTRSATDPLAPLPASEFGLAQAAHLLRRAGFGGPPEDVAALHARGLDGAISHLLDYEQIDNPVEPFVPFQTDGPNVREATSPEERQKLFQEHRRRDYAQLHAIKSWWFARMCQTSRPLEERMTLFWHNHFTSGHRDVKNSYHMYIQNTVLRRHATGDFRAFCKAIARDMAMLEYLDNRANRKAHPNENFARELLELFTLGVGNYTEDDIKETARAFTGWTFRQNEFHNARVFHDEGQKTILGRTGAFDGDQVIDLVLEQPAAARFIAGKLFREFAHDAPSEATIEALARTLRESGWQIKPVLRQLLASREFYGPNAVGTKIKGPVELLVSLVRTLGTDPGVSVVLVGLCDQLSQHLMDPPNVKGWPGGAEWITTSLLLERYNAAQLLVSSRTELEALGRRISQRLLAYQRTLREAEGMDPESTMGSSLRYAQGNLKQLAAYDVAARVADCRTPEQVVDRLTGMLLAVPAPPELRAVLIGELGPARNGRFDLEALHGLLKLIVSTPEFQLS